MNDNIVDEIKKYVRPLPKLQLYKEVIVSVYNAKTRMERNDIKQLNSQLDEANKRLSKARELLLTGDIDADDYRIIKSETETKVNRLEVQLTASVTDTTSIEPLWNKAISNISQLNVLYTEGTVTQQRKVISSMFPEKLTFAGFQYRTNRVNEAIRLMCLIDSRIKNKKKGTSLTFSHLSQEVIQCKLKSFVLGSNKRMVLPSQGFSSIMACPISILPILSNMLKSSTTVSNTSHSSLLVSLDFNFLCFNLHLPIRKSKSFFDEEVEVTIFNSPFELKFNLGIGIDSSGFKEEF